MNTALLDLTFLANEKSKIKSSTFFVNKLTEEVFEGGRNGEATIFEETAPSEGLLIFMTGGIGSSEIVMVMLSLVL